MFSSNLKINLTQVHVKTKLHSSRFDIPFVLDRDTSCMKLLYVCVCNSITLNILLFTGDIKEKRIFLYMGADITTRPHGHWRYTRRRVLLKWNVNIPLRPKHIHIHPYVYTLCNAKFLQTVGVARIPAVVGVSRLLVPAGMTGGEFWKNVILSGRASRELRSSLFANSPAESARDALRMWKHTTHRQIHACTHRKLTCYTYLFFGFILASRISLQRRVRVRQCFQKCLPPPQKSIQRTTACAKIVF